VSCRVLVPDKYRHGVAALLAGFRDRRIDVAGMVGVFAAEEALAGHVADASRIQSVSIRNASLTSRAIIGEVTTATFH
jgi:hypothetical protein